jgi:hypothetical protein
MSKRKRKETKPEKDEKSSECGLQIFFLSNFSDDGEGHGLVAERPKVGRVVLAAQTKVVV